LGNALERNKPPSAAWDERIVKGWVKGAHLPRGTPGLGGRSTLISSLAQRVARAFAGIFAEKCIVNADVGHLGEPAASRRCPIIKAYSLAFFDRYLRNRPAALLDGPSELYPDVRVVRRR
jgi:hypothetical protein